MINTKHHTKLSRAIMRRVYYAYSMSILVTKATLWGFLFGASVIGFWKLVSVMSIINNLMSTKVGEVPNYALSSMAHTETITLMVFGIIVFTILSLGIRVGWPEMRVGRQMQST